MSDRANLQRLFADYMSGEMGPDDLRTLEAALTENADLRRAFIEYLNVDSALGDLAALSAAELAELDAVQSGCVAPASKPVLARRGGRVLILLGAMAATFLLAAPLWIAGPVPRPVARLVAKVDAELCVGGQEWGRPELPAGAYTLERGLLHLQFGGGVKVYLEAPARFDAASDKRVVLHSGRLSAHVPPAGVGFTVETPEAEVVDYGTEFSIDVAGGASEVHVFAGLVRVQPRTSDDRQAKPIDLRRSQAVRIDRSLSRPVNIELATDRFIRSFDEPRRPYARSVKRLSPVAYYRMPIRDRGLICEPPQYSGEVLTGEGRRPPHARGFLGGSLRVLADSSGRGGVAKAGPPLHTGQFTLVALVYAEARAAGGTVVTNMSAGEGNFALTLDEAGMLKATVRTAGGELRSCTSKDLLPLKTWRQVVVTGDGDRLRLFEEGQLAASIESAPLRRVGSGPIWFGTGSDGVGLWNGRIDEVALFHRALSAAEVAAIYKAAPDQLPKARRGSRSGG